jgi:hypothetical protein
MRTKSPEQQQQCSAATDISSITNGRRDQVVYIGNASLFVLDSSDDNNGPDRIRLEYMHKYSIGDLIDPDIRDLNARASWDFSVLLLFFSLPSITVYTGLT